MPRESKRKENKPITLEISDVIYAFVGFFMIMISILLFQKGKRRRLLDLFKKKIWLAGFLSIILWSTYVLANDRGKSDKKSIRRYKATKHAIVAFLIALFAYIELTIAPFWTIWIVTYYLGDLD